MKKTFIFLMLASAGIISCTSKNNSADDTASVGTDSSMMSKDNTAMPASTDTATANMNSVSPDAPSSSTAAAVKPDASKKGKKGKVSIVMPAAGTGEMTPDKEGYYSNTEILPAYPGGQKALENFLLKNIQYPADATDNGIEGTVNVNFSVDENGKLYSPKVISEKIGYGLEDEALAAFKKMPKWTPGKIKGKNVKTRYTLPVTFMLSE
jgi:periplasmic protein TonB